MLLFRTIRAVWPSISNRDASIYPSRGRSGSRRVPTLKVSLRFLCGLGVIASFGFSTSVFAQANGSKPIDQINYAQKLISYANTHAVCSSTYIKNSTYLADCKADLKELTSLVTTWESKLKARTLTVAYDKTVEDDLYIYEIALRTVLEDSGYKYTAVRQEGGLSPAYQISPDEISPEGVSPDSNAALCAACGVTAGSAMYVCLVETAAWPVALICGIGVAAGYIVCAYDNCPIPLSAPVICSYTGERMRGVLSGRTELTARAGTRESYG